MRIAMLVLAFVVGTGALLHAEEVASTKFRSHAPARTLPAASDRPPEAGPSYFVHPADGNDSWEGTKERPWRTIGHGVTKLKPGDTLVLRGGTYYEHVVAQLNGTLDEPITIRSHPGELAILDGGLREFFDSPATAWEPCPGGAEGEFRSVKTLEGLAKDAGEGPAVFGNFGDSLVPLQAYRFHGDLRSDNPFWNVTNKVGDESFVYCGPGVFFDAATSRIHCRLAHTKLSGLGDDNYRGETDPRKLPLVIAGGDQPPLALRECQNVRLWDLVLRGSREATLQVQDCQNIELDGVTAYGGSAAMQVRDTHGLRMQHCACRGIGAPWTFRGMLKYRSVEARIFSASGWDPTGNDNRDFEIRLCEFTDCVDGVFLGNVRRAQFYFNLVENVTDDGVFLTAGTGFDGQTHGGDIFVYQNRFARILTTFAFGVGHGRQRMTEKGKQTGSGVWIYRNVFDLRRPVWYTWPAGPDAPQEITSRGRFGGDHGSPSWEPMWIYHNTIIAGGTPRYDYGCDGLIHGLARGTSRRVFNNIVCLTEGTPGSTLPNTDLDFDADANLFWSLRPDRELPKDPFAKFRASPAYAESKRIHPAGWTTHDKVGDPKFRELSHDWRAEAWLDLGPGSPAIGAGVALPADWPDPLHRDTAGVNLGALIPGTLTPVGAHGMVSIDGNPRLPASVHRLKWQLERNAVAPVGDLHALIVEGYPAFDAPIAAYLLRKAGWKVDVSEKVWCDANKLADQLVVYDGSLARAKAFKTAFDAQDLALVKGFLEAGGTLVLMRERNDLFASPEGRKFLAEIVGSAARQPKPELRVRQPEHRWLKQLATSSDTPLPWLAKGTAISTSKGESLIGSDGGASLLHLAPVGKGRLIYVGWSPAASIPHGRMVSTVEEEEVFDAQVKIFQGVLSSASGQ